MKKAIIGVLVFFALVYGSYRATEAYQNRRPTPDLYYDVYTKQDTVPEGKVAVFLVGLSMSEDYEPFWWNNIFEHVRRVVIPWPGRFFVGLDMGVALLDPERFWEYEDFTPTDLVDPYGSCYDIDGIPYIEKYRRGELEWQPPSGRLYLDNGYFLYKGRKGGVPSVAGKKMASSNLWYYGKGFKDKKVPHRYQMEKVIDLAFENLTKKYGNFPFYYADSMNPWEIHQELYELLDGGADTIVLASPMTIASHYEEFEGGWLESFEVIHRWEKERGKGKKIKIIMAPPMGHFPPLRQGFVYLLKDRLDTLPPKASVKIAISVHGMPWDHVPHEAWLKFAPGYLDPLQEDIRTLISTYDFSRTELVVSNDHFADPVWDPEEKYLSTNRAYLEGKHDGFDYVVQQPMEFYTENTDTMFSHAQHNYHHFPGYSRYETIDYPDWDVPYTREFDLDGTRTIYNGVMVGKYRHYVADALTQSIDSILVKSASMQAKVQK